MDATLHQIIAALVSAHKELDTLREEVKRLQAQVTARAEAAPATPKQGKAVP
mgnify:CR=1